MFLFDVNFIIAELWGYKLSLVEFLGVVTGLITVIQAAREKLSSWPIGIVNLVFFFVLFYQVHLYSDMILQVFFLVTTVYGWWKWVHPKSDFEAKGRHLLRITRLSGGEFAFWSVFIVLGTAFQGLAASQFHNWFPMIFNAPASFPYPDAFTLVASVAAQILLTRKKIETWILWAAVDIVSVVLYWSKGIYLMSIEYAVFTAIVVFGFFGWFKEWEAQKKVPSPALS